MYKKGNNNMCGVSLDDYTAAMLAAMCEQTQLTRSKTIRMAVRIASDVCAIYPEAIELYKGGVK